MYPSEPGVMPDSERTDLKPSALGEQINVFCTRCGAYRLSILPQMVALLVECLACKTRDPKRYWSRDWEKTDD